MRNVWMRIVRITAKDEGGYVFMASTLERNIPRSPLIGFAHHRIVLDETGKPVDYEFLEVNETFERLTGLTREDVLRKTVVDVLPGIREGDFDWVAFYGEVALGAGEREFEQYSKALPPEKGSGYSSPGLASP